MGARPGTNFTTDDLDYIGRGREDRYSEWGTAEVLTAHREGISVGQALDGISDLGHLHRQLLEDSDFHSAGNTLLRKLTPEEENEKYLFDGRFLSKELRDILLSLEEIGLDASYLKSIIQLVTNEQDEIALAWIEENWETFLEVKPEDALAKAEYDIEDFSDTGDFSSYNPTYIKERYTPPRDSYKVLEKFRKNMYKEAAEKRIVSLKNRLHAIQECSSLEEIEKELNRTREIYQEDKQLLAHWTPQRKIEDRKLYLYMLHREREKQEALELLDDDYEPDLDFEMIRLKVWFCFDKEQEETITENQTKPYGPNWLKHYNPKTGEIGEEALIKDEKIQQIIKQGKPDPRVYISEKEITKSCVWEIEKSKEFCNLNQTSKQWNRVYEYIWEKMTDIITFNIKYMKKASEANSLCNFIRRYQFRIDSKKVGDAILKKARKAQTIRGRNVIQMLLSSCQYQLDPNVIQEIVKEVYKRRV